MGKPGEAPIENCRTCNRLAHNNKVQLANEDLAVPPPKRESLQTNLALFEVLMEWTYQLDPTGKCQADPTGNSKDCW